MPGLPGLGLVWNGRRKRKTNRLEGAWQIRIVIVDSEVPSQNFL